MRICLVGAWADYAVKDIEDGYLEALRAAGHEVYHYQLSARLDDAGKDLHKRWHRGARLMGYQKPTGADVAYYAGKDLIERVLWFQPEWVIVVGGKSLHPQLLEWIRQRLGIKTAILLTESPYEDVIQADFVRYFDLAWTNERTSVPFLRHGNPCVFYMPHAFDPQKHRQDDEHDVYLFPNERGMQIPTPATELPAHEVLFVGTAFPERIEMLSAVDWTGIDLGLYGHWTTIGSRSPLRKYVRGGVINNYTTSALYRRATIGLNLYRVSEGMNAKSPRTLTAESLNPRAYELAASGCFQISDYRPEVRETFGDSVPTFISPADLGPLVRRYLADPQRRLDCIDWAYQVVEGQTYAERVERMISDLTRYDTLQALRPQLAGVS